MRPDQEEFLNKRHAQLAAMQRGDIDFSLCPKCAEKDAEITDLHNYAYREINSLNGW